MHESLPGDLNSLDALLCRLGQSDTMKKDQKTLDDLEELNIGKQAEIGEHGFSDKEDIIKHALEIHEKDSPISEDYILFHSDEKDVEFIRGLYTCASSLQSYIKDKDTAKRIFRTVMHQAHIVAILKRNRYKNPIGSGIFALHNADPDEDKGIMDKIKSSILGKEKKNLRPGE